MTPVEILDKASAAAWGTRSRSQAIAAARSVLDKAPVGESAAAFTAWLRTLGYDGPTQELGVWLVGRYRNPGDIALSLTRAAFITSREDTPHAP